VLRDTVIYVDCLRDGKDLWTFDFLSPATAGPSVPPPDEYVISQAKEGLKLGARQPTL
jgi:hypothetical protein